MWGDPSMPEPPSGLQGGQGFQGTDVAGENCVYTIQGVSFYLQPRYKPRAMLGRGAFGVVWYDARKAKCGRGF